MGRNFSSLSAEVFSLLIGGFGAKCAVLLEKRMKKTALWEEGGFGEAWGLQA